MNELKSIATAIITNLSNVDLKPTTNNLNNLIAIHNCVARIIEIAETATTVKATEIPAEEEKKVDTK